ncbi:chitin deacetylase 1 [Absidia repens]|uniref:chitin deacetylase n=1 Tax=Absidia repens TaxID=90262 RepID=A0A1X2IVE1_9FUNG|nr:chitin deacetylase 1 [Absidia repens]
MYIKSIAASIVVGQTLVSAATNVQDYWKSFNSTTDPLNITLPSIQQTTSNDPTTECVNYETPAQFKYDSTQWPTMWETATSNGMNTSAEFTALYNSIKWTDMPNIPVRTLGSDGALNMTGYDEANDPDCWWSASTCTKPKHQNVNEDIYQCAEPETWGLTYDDGPNCSHNAFYDYLEQQKLTASMFYIGSNVINWPYGAMRGIKDGHHIADHTWSHQLMTTLTNQEVLAELYYTQKAIKLVTGITPLHWRPAFGDVDDRVRWIATQLGLTTILWSEDTDDWAAGVNEPLATVQQNYDDFIQMGSNGTMSTHGNIVLTHEINNMTMSLAVKNIPNIQKNYKHVIDVATCMNISHPYQETTIKFPSFDEYVSGKTSSTGGNSSSGSGSGSSNSSDSAGTSAGVKSLPTNGLAVAIALTILAALV